MALRHLPALAPRRPAVARCGDTSVRREQGHRDPGRRRVGGGEFVASHRRRGLGSGASSPDGLRKRTRLSVYWNAPIPSAVIV